MRARRGLAIGAVVIGFGLLFGGLSADAVAAGSIRPAPGTPDPKLMVFTSVDLGGARVTAQRYYKDAEFPSVISYERDLEDGRLGSTPLPFVYNEAEVGTSVLTTTRFVATQRRLFGTKQFRSLVTESFVQEIGIDGLITNVQVGRPRNLGVGAGSFDLLITARVLGLRWDLHIAVFRVEHFLGVVGAAGEPGRRVPLSVMTRLSKVMAGRMSAQLVPRNTVLPTVSGNAAVGQTLIATTGTWAQSPTSFVYQWQRCDPAGANCSTITGATNQSYVAADADIGSTIRVSVTARNAAGRATAASAPTSVVSASGAPTNTSVPTISGTAQVGQTLTAGTGSWTGSPTSFGFQWQRCNSSGGSCADIPGATGGTYVLVTADAGAMIRVVVTATNTVGAASAASAPTSVVA